MALSLAKATEALQNYHTYYRIDKTNKNVTKPELIEQLALRLTADGDRVSLRISRLPHAGGLVPASSFWAEAQIQAGEPSEESISALNDFDKETLRRLAEAFNEYYTVAKDFRRLKAAPLSEAVLAKIDGYGGEDKQEPFRARITREGIELLGADEDAPAPAMLAVPKGVKKGALLEAPPQPPPPPPKPKPAPAVAVKLPSAVPLPAGGAPAKVPVEGALAILAQRVWDTGVVPGSEDFESLEEFIENTRGDWEAAGFSDEMTYKEYLESLLPGDAEEKAEEDISPEVYGKLDTLWKVDEDSEDFEDVEEYIEAQKLSWAEGGFKAEGMSFEDFVESLWTDLLAKAEEKEAEKAKADAEEAEAEKEEEEEVEKRVREEAERKEAGFAKQATWPTLPLSTLAGVLRVVEKARADNTLNLGAQRFEDWNQQAFWSADAWRMRLYHILREQLDAGREGRPVAWYPYNPEKKRDNVGILGRMPVKPGDTKQQVFPLTTAILDAVPEFAEVMGEYSVEDKYGFWPLNPFLVNMDAGDMDPKDYREFRKYFTDYMIDWLTKKLERVPEKLGNIPHQAVEFIYEADLFPFFEKYKNKPTAKWWGESDLIPKGKLPMGMDREEFIQHLVDVNKNVLSRARLEHGLTWDDIHARNKEELTEYMSRHLKAEQAQLTEEIAGLKAEGKAIREAEGAEREAERQAEKAKRKPLKEAKDAAEAEARQLEKARQPKPPIEADFDSLWYPYWRIELEIMKAKANLRNKTKDESTLKELNSKPRENIAKYDEMLGQLEELVTNSQKARTAYETAKLRSYPESKKHYKAIFKDRIAELIPLVASAEEAERAAFEEWSKLGIYSRPMKKKTESEEEYQARVAKHEVYRAEKDRTEKLWRRAQKATTLVRTPLEAMRGELKRERGEDDDSFSWWLKFKKDGRESYLPVKPTAEEIERAEGDSFPHPTGFNWEGMRGHGQTHRHSVLKRLKLADKPYSLQELSKASSVPLSILQEVYTRGIGAYKTQPSSVRLKGSYVKNVDAPLSQKLSKEQWGYARVYSFLNGNPKHDEDLRANKKGVGVSGGVKRFFTGGRASSPAVAGQPESPVGRFLRRR